jgi:hypothetical protein
VESTRWIARPLILHRAYGTRTDFGNMSDTHEMSKRKKAKEFNYFSLMCVYILNFEVNIYETVELRISLNGMISLMN